MDRWICSGFCLCCTPKQSSHKSQSHAKKRGMNQKWWVVLLELHCHVGVQFKKIEAAILEGIPLWGCGRHTKAKVFWTVCRILWCVNLIAKWGDQVLFAATAHTLGGVNIAISQTYRPAKWCCFRQHCDFIGLDLLSHATAIARHIHIRWFVGSMPIFADPSQFFLTGA